MSWKCHSLYLVRCVLMVLLIISNSVSIHFITPIEYSKTGVLIALTIFFKLSSVDVNLFLKFFFKISLIVLCSTVCQQNTEISIRTVLHSRYSLCILSCSIDTVWHFLSPNVMSISELILWTSWKRVSKWFLLLAFTLLLLYY